MEDTDLSLGPPQSILSLSMSMSMSMNELDVISAGKRNHQHMPWNINDPIVSQISNNIDLQLNQPLPQDWEQCLDLQSGNMYYLNRKTKKKSWVRPKEQAMDLDLNIPTFPSSAAKANFTTHEIKRQYSSTGNMMALVCVNCHLLVMICKSSPSCPNCKYLHSLPQEAPNCNREPVKPLRTLSLLH